MLKLSQAHYDALRGHGEETYPHECCGILLGHVGSEENEVVDVVRAGNTRTDSAHNRYHIAINQKSHSRRELSRLCAVFWWVSQQL